MNQQPYGVTAQQFGVTTVSGGGSALLQQGPPIGLQDRLGGMVQQAAALEDLLLGCASRLGVRDDPRGPIGGGDKPTPSTVSSLTMDLMAALGRIQTIAAAIQETL